MATVGRTREVGRFLRELGCQTHRELEVVVVDQNTDDRLRPILQPFEPLLTIKHVRSALGLSRARNAGLKHIAGDVVAFPDDDCWYGPHLLQTLAAQFHRHAEWDGITGRPVTPGGAEVMGRFDRDPGPVTKNNVWRRVNSNTLFFRRRLIDRVGDFDETLGVGAGTPWGSSEDVDYPLRAVAARCCLHYDPDCTVFHPDDPRPASDPARLRRAYSYNVGMGRVLRKHQFPLWFVLYSWLGPLKPMTLALVRGRQHEARFFGAMSAGRVRGWLGWG